MILYLFKTILTQYGNRATYELIVFKANTCADAKLLLFYSIEPEIFVHSIAIFPSIFPFFDDETRKILDDGQINYIVRKDCLFFYMDVP